MNFGKWIVVAFVFFALFIATLVTVCVRQDITLVTKEYYKEELVYQEQIDRLNNANSLSEKPEITIKNNQVNIQYNRLPEMEKGTLKLFRPSDANLDQQFSIQPTGETTQGFALKHAAPGLYRARLNWEQQGKEYYLEKIIVL